MCNVFYLQVFVCLIALFACANAGLLFSKSLSIGGGGGGGWGGNSGYSSGGWGGNSGYSSGGWGGNSGGGYSSYSGMIYFGNGFYVNFCGEHPDIQCDHKNAVRMGNRKLNSIRKIESKFRLI